MNSPTAIAIFRLAFLAVSLMSGTAVIVSRSHPHDLSTRIEATSPLLAWGNTFSEFTGSGPRVLNLETGLLSPLKFPPGTSLDRWSLSPWEDRGRRQLVGLISDESSVSMIRMTWPEYEIIDKFNFDIYSSLASPPCWFPGVLARVLYAGADGRIYRVDFESRGVESNVVRIADARPVALNWSASIRPGSKVRVRDLCWTNGPRMEGEMLASIDLMDQSTGKFLDSQIWLLQLDRAEMAVAAAHPLLESTTSMKVQERRHPTLNRNPEGVPTMAYFTRTAKDSKYQLKQITARDYEHNMKYVFDESSAIILAQDCLLAGPALIDGGRRLVVVYSSGKTGSVDLQK